MKEKLFLIIDIGGTKIALAFFTKKGKFVGRKKIPTNPSKGPSDTFDRISKEVGSFLKNRCFPNLPGKIAVGCPGPFDYKTGKIFLLPNLHSWKGYNLKNALKHRFGVPVLIENDANLAGLGEAMFGAGKRYPTVLYITISTGIGGAFIDRGRILRGASGDALEIGHQTIGKSKRKCGCGKYGHLEALASGTAMEEEASDLLSKHKNSKLYSFYKAQKQMSVEIIVKALMAKDDLAKKIWDQAMGNFGIGIANLIQILNPHIIVIGGGVTKAWHQMMPSLNKALRKYAWPRSLKATRIVRAKLGDSAADWGGYYLLTHS